jgi:hypothetical protein
MSRKGTSKVDTLKRSRSKGVAEYIDVKRIPYSHNDLFNFHDVSKEQGWAMLEQDSWTADQRHEHIGLSTDNRGR